MFVDRATKNLTTHTIILYIIALVLLLLSFLYDIQENYVFIFRLVLLIGAVIIAIIPSIYAFRMHSAFTWKNAVQDINATMGDVLAVRKEYKIVQSQMEGINTHIINTIQAQRTLTDTVINDHIKTAEYITQFIGLIKKVDQKLDKELAMLRAHEEAWINTSVQYVETLDQQSDNEQLSDEYRKSLKKSIADFDRTFESVGLKIINPQEGESFNDIKHEAEKEEPNNIINKGEIVRCFIPGFIYGENVIKKAKVILSAGKTNLTTSKEEIKEK